MKKIALIALFGLLVAFVISCDSKKEKPQKPKPGVVEIVGTFVNTDGNKVIEIIAREIKTVAYWDSAKQDNAVKIDTQYYRPAFVVVKDSAGKVVIDSATMQPKMLRNYKPIGKDSVNWRITNIPVSELLKK